jgi:hypothetical protein
MFSSVLKEKILETPKTTNVSTATFITGTLKPLPKTFLFKDILNRYNNNCWDEPVPTTSTVHHVEPHWRTLENGQQIWVDGDGDSSTNLTEEQGGGFFRSNPDCILSNNLDK